MGLGVYGLHPIPGLVRFLLADSTRRLLLFVLFYKLESTETLANLCVYSIRQHRQHLNDVPQVRRRERGYPYRSSPQPFLAWFAVFGCLFLLFIASSAPYWGGRFYTEPFLSSYLVVSILQSLFPPTRHRVLARCCSVWFILKSHRLSRCFYSSGSCLVSNASGGLHGGRSTSVMQSWFDASSRGCTTSPRNGLGRMTSRALENDDE